MAKKAFKRPRMTMPPPCSKSGFSDGMLPWIVIVLVTGRYPMVMFASFVLQSARPCFKRLRAREMSSSQHIAR